MKKFVAGMHKIVAYVLALALVIGTIVIPSQVTVSAANEALVLGEPVFEADGVSYHLSNVKVTLPAGQMIQNIAIHVDNGQLNPGNVDQYGSVQKFSDSVGTTYIFKFNSSINAENTQKLLRQILFTTVNKQPQTVNVKLNNYATNIPDGVKVTALDGENGTHYYMFIVNNDNISWANAYNAAKNFSLMGMKGYLTTITSEKEEKIIDNVSDQPGWGGGIRKESYATDANAITLDGGDNNGIIHFDGDDVNRNDQSNFTKFFWACGPEKGRAFGAKDNSQGYQHWRENASANILEPNNDHSGGNETRNDNNAEGCLHIHYKGTDDEGWNDLPNRTTSSNPINGYFVEFGGYPVVNGQSTDPGLAGNTEPIIADERISVDPNITYVTVQGNIEGGEKNNAKKVVLVNDATGVEYSGNVGGTYYNIPNVPAGNYTVKVLDGAGNDMSPTPDKLTVPSNQGNNLNQNFTVEKSIPITGKMTGTAADAVTKVTFTQEGTNKTFEGKVVKVDNTYTITGVPVGYAYTVTVDVNDVRYSKTRIEVKDNAPAGNYDFQVDYITTTVKGKITGTGAGDAAKVEITKDGKVIKSGTADPNTKQYFISGVPVGDYQVVVKDNAGKILKTEDLKVPSNPSNPINRDINVDKDGKPDVTTVTGKVTGSDANNVDKVIFTAPDGRRYEAVVKRNEYKIPNVPVGVTYTVSVEGTSAKPDPQKFTVTGDAGRSYDIKVNSLQDQAKDAIDQAANDAKEKIDDKLGLSDEDKDNAKNNIDQIAKNAKNQIDNAGDADKYPGIVDGAKNQMDGLLDGLNGNLDKAKEEAKKTIDKLPNLSDKEKDNYKKAVDDKTSVKDVEKTVLDAIKDNAKKEIDKLPNLSKDEKNQHKNDVDNAKSKKGVEKELFDAIKDDAKKAIDKLPNLSDLEKKGYKKDVDDSKTKEDVKKAVLDATKDDAKREIEKKAADAKKVIDNTKNVTDAQKKAAKEEVAKAAKKAKDEIDKANTTPDVKKAVADGKKAIDDVVKKLQGNGKLTPEEEELIRTTPTLEEVEKLVLGANTDKGDVAGSRFSKIRLKATGKKNAIKLNWVKQSGADGYIIYGAACGKNIKYKKVKTITNGKTTTWTQKKRKTGKYYKYMVVAYREIAGTKRVIEKSNGAHATTLGGKKGNATKVNVKKDKVTLKVGKTSQIKASYKCDKKVQQHIAIIRYESTNKKVATVSKKGKIKAVKKGKCTIFVYTQNGYWKKVKVTVK